MREEGGWDGMGEVWVWVKGRRRSWYMFVFLLECADA